MAAASMEKPSVCDDGAKGVVDEPNLHKLPSYVLLAKSRRMHRVLNMGIITACLPDGGVKYRLLLGDILREIGRCKAKAPTMCRVRVNAMAVASMEKPSVYEDGAEGAVDEPDLHKLPSYVLLAKSWRMQWVLDMGIITAHLPDGGAKYRLLLDDILCEIGRRKDEAPAVRRHEGADRETRRQDRRLEDTLDKLAPLVSVADQLATLPSKVVALQSSAFENQEQVRALNLALLRAENAQRKGKAHAEDNGDTTGDGSINRSR
ncbi:hypothetical protein GUJ93_ZPchr0006g42485 [Zizania palustris]|uniref:Uncharacterized protein n=1 Tax=Zizania palustris TaxID=103762 RepID=A0A8J5TG21_ZIZPA|nr:hypothetical protein GUJ93_ZPchr0006g42485 [Zizania palustris]